MTISKRIVVFVTAIFFFSCKENKEIDFSLNNCKKNPDFISSMGFDPSRSYLSTSEQRIMGLVLIESDNPGQPNERVLRKIQHPSWKKGGWLAPILIDDKGNIYTAPAPFISIQDNPIANNNTIYRIDNAAGEMKEYLRLPLADSINTENPFGIIGMAYLCETGTLYVSSVAGSSRYQEKGYIYAINTSTGKIIDEIKNTDAMGLGISYITGSRTLFFGKGRSTEVMSIELKSNGKFSGNPRPVFSLTGLGPRGDDRVRKIRPDQNGNLIVHGIEFNFNLIAPREKQETLYRFIYLSDENKWIYQ
jgi:hypothetical protein